MFSNRFGSHLAGSETVKRVMKIKNEAPVGKFVNFINMVIELINTYMVGSKHVGTKGCLDK